MLRDRDERQLLELMAPYQNDAVSFALDLGVRVNEPVRATLERISAARDGGVVGLPSEEIVERSALWACFWWCLRRPSSLVVVGCVNEQQRVKAMALVYAMSTKVSARIAEHITFPADRLRMIVAGSPSWGMVFEVCSKQRGRHEAPHLATLEFSVGHQGNDPLNVPSAEERPDILRISTWDPLEPPR